MAPMMATVDEVRSFGNAARAAGLPSIGVMIETPAAVVQADQILAEVDFLSIGTNDLAQYAFAADRHLASLASLNDPWQPALLRMIDMVARAASDSGKPVGCAARLQPIRCSRWCSRAWGFRAFPWHPQHSLRLVTALARSLSRRASKRRGRRPRPTHPLMPGRLFGASSVAEPCMTSFFTRCGRFAWIQRRLLGRCCRRQ